MGTNIGKLLKHVNDHMIFFANNDLKSCGLTHQQGYIMGFINKGGGRRTQKEIEEFLEVSHPTVVGLVSRLEENGYVSISIDEKDRRNRIITQTEKATKNKQMMDERIKRHSELIEENLTENEKEELVRLLNKVDANLIKAIQKMKEE